MTETKISTSLAGVNSSTVRLLRGQVLGDDGMRWLYGTRHAIIIVDAVPEGALMHFEAADAQTQTDVKELLQDAQYIADTVLRDKLGYGAVHFHSTNDKFIRLVSRGAAKIVGEYEGKHVYEYALGVYDGS